jgi:hypothetical protein
VDISGTRMACCTSQEEANNANGGLPSFLQFSKRYQQVMHASLTSRICAGFVGGSGSLLDSST